MPEQTMQQAADELHAAAVALTELIKREYPSRREVERRFVSKANNTKRAIWMGVFVLISSMLSFVFTVATVSGCFLGGDDDRPALCSALPGYTETEQRREEVNKLFRELVKITRSNDERISRLEGQ